MFVAMNSVTVPRVPWPEFAHLAHRTGYAGVDLNLARAIKEGLDSTRALPAELKLKPSVAALPVEFRKDEATFRQALEKLSPAAQFARSLNAPRMITWIEASSDTPKPELRKLYRERFRSVAKILARHKVMRHSGVA